MNGVSCFTGDFRDFSGGKLRRGIRIPKTPWKTITLARSATVEWKPIIGEFVNVQRRQNVRGTRVDKKHGQVTIPVTIPLPEIAGKSWAALLDEFINKKFKEKTNGE